MELAMIGLGKMGANMSDRLLRAGHSVVAYDINPAAVRAAQEKGAVPAYDLTQLASALTPPRIAWLMVPSGEITENTLQALVKVLSQGDILIDGGNSNYKDSQRRARWLAGLGLHFIDVGTSGGVWGLTQGYSLMVGGDPAVVDRCRPIFTALAPGSETGWGHVGPSGAGHFVKMIHNGIEYGIMQAYAEGFEILKKKTEFDLDLHQVAEIWRFGSVVRSWLLDLTARALASDQELADVQAWVADSGEGRWTVFEAIDLDVAAPVITAALQRRLRSREEAPYSDKLLAAMRNQFGGHAVRRKSQE